MFGFLKGWREYREKCGCRTCKNSLYEDIYEGRALWKQGMYWQDVVLEHIHFAVKCGIFISILWAMTASVAMSAMRWIQKMPTECQQVVVNSFKTAKGQ